MTQTPLQILRCNQEPDTFKASTIYLIGREDNRLDIMVTGKTADVVKHIAQDESVDYRQWVNVLDQRLFNTTYTNSTARPILVRVTRLKTADSALGFLGAVVNGVTLESVGASQNGSQQLLGFLEFTVPVNGTYRVQVTGGAWNAAIRTWVEYR